MYGIGEYVSYKTTGICVVDGMTEMEIPGTKDKREYYVLKPVYEEGGVIYCPSEQAEVALRQVLSKTEAKSLLDEIDDLPMYDFSNKKILDEACKNAIGTGLSREYLIVMKTLWTERVQRVAQGKKITSTNERFFKTCQDKFCGELAIALGQEKADVVSMIKDILDTKITL